MMMLRYVATSYYLFSSCRSSAPTQTDKVLIIVIIIIIFIVILIILMVIRCPNTDQQGALTRRNWQKLSKCQLSSSIMKKMIKISSFINNKSPIQLLESPCSSVRWSVGPEKSLHHIYMHQGQGSWIYASFISASYTYASGSRIIYICIVDTCI